MVADGNAGPFRARRRRREPRGTSMRRPRPEPWPRRRQRRRIMRREQPCDHERPHRPRCGTFKAQPPRRLPPRSCTNHAAALIDAFCTDASRSTNRTNLMHLRVAGQRQPHESTAVRTALMARQQSWGKLLGLPQRNITNKAPGAARSLLRSLRGLVAARKCVRNWRELV